MENFEINGLHCVSERFLTELNGKYGIFKEYFEVLLIAAEEIRGKPELMRFIALVCRALREEKGAWNETKKIEFPKSKDASLAYDLTPFFSILSTIEDTVETLKQRRIPERILVDSLRQYEGVLQICKLRFDRLMCNEVYFSWLPLLY